MPRKTVRKSKKVSNKRRKKKTWKFFALSNKKKANIKRFFILPFTFALCLLLLIAGFGIKKLNLPFASASSVSSDDLKSFDLYTIALLEVSSFENSSPKIISIRLLFVDKADSYMRIFNISPEIKVELPGKFSEEELSKVLHLGQLEQSEDTLLGSSKLITETLEKYVGYNINRVLIFDKSISSEVNSILLEGKVGELFNADLLYGLNSSIATDLTFSELRYTINLMNEFSLDETDYVNVTASTDQVQLDKTVKDISFNSKIMHEKVSTAVLNGTTVPGLAAYGTRLLENAGMHVITTSNAARLYTESLIVTNNKESETVRYIADLFEIENIISKEELDINAEYEVERADVTLIIGLDIASKL